MGSPVLLKPAGCRRQLVRDIWVPPGAQNGLLSSHKDSALGSIAKPLVSPVNVPSLHVRKRKSCSWEDLGEQVAA